MGKSKWKIYQVKENCFVAVIPSNNPKWKIEWHSDYEGNYGPSYYDQDRKDSVTILCFKKFDTGNEAAEYINNIERKKSFFVKDVTEGYFV
jgi:hypothetical protein